MDTSKFKEHLDYSLQLLLDITRQFCYNHFAETFQYIIQPSGNDFHDGLNEFEKKNLVSLNRQADKLLSIEQVITLLCHNNKVPLWINTTVYESKRDSTVIHLLCSRRLRDDSDLFYLAVKYPPFNVFVPLPPDPLRKDINGKFDINWRKELDDRQKPTNIFAKFARLFIATQKKDAL